MFPFLNSKTKCVATGLHVPCPSSPCLHSASIPFPGFYRRWVHRLQSSGPSLSPPASQHLESSLWAGGRFLLNAGALLAYRSYCTWLSLKHYVCSLTRWKTTSVVNASSENPHVYGVVVRTLQRPLSVLLTYLSSNLVPL